jgi:hypothetical protein
MKNVIKLLLAQTRAVPALRRRALAGLAIASPDFNANGLDPKTLAISIVGGGHSMRRRDVEGLLSQVLLNAVAARRASTR